MVETLKARPGLFVAQLSLIDGAPFRACSRDDAQPGGCAARGLQRRCRNTVGKHARIKLTRAPIDVNKNAWELGTDKSRTMVRRASDQLVDIGIFRSPENCDGEPCRQAQFGIIVTARVR